jgi:hypothetical protein
VALSSPTVAEDIVNPSTISVIWNSSWTRWDGGAYALSYPPGYNDSATTLNYNLKYSKDNGVNWAFLDDDSTAEPGIYDSSHVTPSTFTYTWDLSNAVAFPQGSYILRAECYRGNRALHYSYQQRRLYIKR